MRIERTGSIPPLTPRIVRFLIEGMKARSLDDDPASQEVKRPDYVCFNGLLVIELKTLEGDGSERIAHFADELRKRDDFPHFLGSVPVESVLKKLNNPDPVRRELTTRVGRSIISHMRKANKQLAAHAARVSRKNVIRILVLINEDHELYEPRVVGHVVSTALSKKVSGRFVYDNIDAVVYVTERHATNINGQIAFPLLSILGPAIGGEVWKEALIGRFTEGWAAWNHHPLYEDVSKLDEFATIDHIPDEAPRHERWRLEYRRNRHMQHYTNEQLRDRFDETTILNLLAFTKGAPLKFPTEAIMINMQVFTHIMEEMGKRAVPVTEFPYSLERYQAAARRLNLPPIVIDWLAALHAARNS